MSDHKSTQRTNTAIVMDSMLKGIPVTMTDLGGVEREFCFEAETYRPLFKAWNQDGDEVWCALLYDFGDFVKMCEAQSDYHITAIAANIALNIL